jgi:hypothetical protein
MEKSCPNYKPQYDTELHVQIKEYQYKLFVHFQEKQQFNFFISLINAFLFFNFENL